MVRQIPLDLETPEPFAAARFVTTPALAQVVTDLLSPQCWPSPHACLVGPEGSGRTHLLHMFAEATSGTYLSAEQTRKLDISTLPEKEICIDDAENADEETLFHLFNRALSLKTALLFASQTQPLVWNTVLPDLQSRVRSLRILTLPEPDETLLMAIVKKLFDQRAIRPSEDTLEFLIKRMERSVTAAQKIVIELEHYANGRPFNRLLIRDFFADSAELPFDTPDMFDTP